MTNNQEKKNQSEGKKKNEQYEALKTQVIVKLHMLIGACRISSIKKKDIEQSMQRFIDELERQKP